MKMINNMKDYVYMDCTVKMSKDNLANLMYAFIITEAQMTTSFGIGIYEYSRSQNTYNQVDVKVFIHPSKIDMFEFHSKVKLRNPISVTIQ